MGKIEVDINEVNRPLKWMIKKSSQGGLILTASLVILGVGYFLIVLIGLLILLPILWLYDNLV